MLQCWTALDEIQQPSLVNAAAPGHVKLLPSSNHTMGVYMPKRHKECFPIMFS